MDQERSSTNQAQLLRSFAEAVDCEGFLHLLPRKARCREQRADLNSAESVQRPAGLRPPGKNGAWGVVLGTRSL